MVLYENFDECPISLNKKSITTPSKALNIHLYIIFISYCAKNIKIYKN